MTDSAEQALSIMQIERCVNKQLEDNAKLKNKAREHKMAIDDALQNDSEYRRLDQAVKDANRAKRAYKQRFMADPAIQQQVTAWDGIKSELKDGQIALSDYLREYQRVSGMNQFETSDGQVLEIVSIHKLVRKES